MQWAGVVTAIIVAITASLILLYRNPPELMPICPNFGRRHPVVRFPSAWKPDKGRVLTCMTCGYKIGRSGKSVDR
jgi:hypothetical protein